MPSNRASLKYLHFELIGRDHANVVQVACCYEDVDLCRGESPLLVEPDLPSWNSNCDSY